MTQNWTHIPIMAPQIAEFLLLNPNGVYVDGTLGLGGHTKFFLSKLGPQARILGFDKDEEALKMAAGIPGLVNKLLIVDTLSMKFDIIALTADPTCPVCGGK